MKKLKRFLRSRLSSGQAGQALILVLIFLMLGGLTLVPTLTHISTALLTGKTYEKNTYEYYAADSGIDDAIWRIKYDCIDPAYKPYDYSTNWTYNLDEQLNRLPTNVTIRNVWIPTNASPPADLDRTDEIVKENKLSVAGSVSITDNTCIIVINFYPDYGDSLTIDSVGVWLPSGFTYNTGSSNLEADHFKPYYSLPQVTQSAGGQTVIWNFNRVHFTDFPGPDGTGFVAADDNPQVSEITFHITPAVAGTKPTMISWLNTRDSGTITNILPCTWDVDTRILKILSTSGDTQVEAYSSRCELRKMISAIGGDYVATGNTVLYGSGGGYRQYWTSVYSIPHSSTQTVSSIPRSEQYGYADVIAAYLYWSGWFDEGTKTSVFNDGCSSLTNWVTASGTLWSAPGQFRAHGSASATEAQRTLTLKNSLNIPYTSPERIMISWDQNEDGTLESGDGLDYSFSTDGGSSWSEDFVAFQDDLTTAIQRKFKLIIPTEYQSANFKIRFKLVGFNESDDNYCYIDNIKIEKVYPDNTATFKIKDTQTPGREHTETITASKVQVLPNSDGSYNNYGYSYSSFADVTNLVKDWCETANDTYSNVHLTGNAEYTVGNINASVNDDWSYAGWSIIIIYSSPKTAGHQLYLFDNFQYADMYTDMDFDHDGAPGGTISGFMVPQQIPGEVNAGKLTCFVGEGDLSYTGDFIAFNAPESYWKGAGADPPSIPDQYKLWDGINCTGNSQTSPNNVWNNKSLGLTVDGIDIDTFDLPWATAQKPWLLQPGDSSAHIDLPTQVDSWNLIYMILSFRSKTIIGGTTNYTIHGG